MGGDKNSTVSDRAAKTSCSRLAQAWQCPDGFSTGQEGGSPIVRAESKYPPLAPLGRHPPDSVGH